MIKLGQILKPSLLARSVVLTAGTNLLSVGLGSLSGLVLAAALGPSGRGELTTIIAWPGITGAIAALGLHQATCYWVASDRSNAKTYVSTALLAVFLLGSAVGLLGVVAAPLIGHNETTIRGLRAMFLTLPLYMIPGVWSGALQATKFGLWNLSRMIQPVSYLAAIGGLLVTERLSVATAVNALILSFTLQVLVVGLMAWNEFGSWLLFKKSSLRPLFRFGLQSVVVYAPSLVNTRVDLLLLSLAVSSRELGQYSVAVSLSLLATPLSSALGNVAFPRIASLGAIDTSRIQRAALLGSLGVGILVLVPLMAAAPWAIPAIFGKGFRGAIGLFLVLGPAGVLLMVNQVAEDILRGRGNPAPAALAELAGTVVTVTLLTVLLPLLGVMSAAVASLVSYALVLGILLHKLKIGIRQAPIAGP